MAPRSLTAATLAATVLLAAVCPVAGADPESDASAETTGSSAEEAPAGGGTAGGVQALAQDTAAAAAGAAAEVVSTSAAPQQGGSGGAPTSATSSPATPSATPPPPAQQEAATGTTARSPAEPQTAPQPPSGGDLSRSPATGDVSRPAPPAPQVTPPKTEAAKVVAPAPTVPAPPPSTPEPVAAAAAPPKPSPPKHADGLERLLHHADRGLREIQGQIGALGRRLEVGGFAPTTGFVRLRHGLDRIAPVLRALDARLDTAPPLIPRLKALVHRVHSRLERAQASSRDLISALVRSGVDGPALRLLLRELERFVAFDSAPAVTLGERPDPAPLGAPEPAPYTAYTQIEAAPAAAPHDGAAAHSPGRRGDGRHAEGQRDPGSPQDVPPSSPAPGSASASPGGVFSAAGLASLAALLAALALTGPRMRLQPTASRLYRAAFLTPLERPG